MTLVEAHVEIFWFRPEKNLFQLKLRAALNLGKDERNNNHLARPKFSFKLELIQKIKSVLKPLHYFQLLFKPFKCPIICHSLLNLFIIPFQSSQWPMVKTSLTAGKKDSLLTKFSGRVILYGQFLIINIGHNTRFEPITVLIA